MSDVRRQLRELLPESLSARLVDEPEFDSWIAASPDELVTWLAGLESPVLENAAGLLARLGSDAVGTLTRAESQATTKGARKLLRRALHQLRSQGVRVEIERPEGRGGRLPAVEEGEAFVGPIDPQAQRIVLWLAPIRGGARLFRILVSDEEGVLRADMMEGRRGEARALVKEMQSRIPGGLTPAPPSAVRCLLSSLLPLGAPEGDGGAAALRAELERSPRDGKTPGELVRDRLAGARLGASVAADELRRRVERGDVAPWLLRGERIDALVRELDEVERSPIVLAPVQKQGRRTKVLEHANQILFDAETRDRLATRLQETAYVLDARGDRDGAIAALQEADGVRSAERPQDAPFLRMVLELSLGTAKQEVQEEQKGKLIIPG
jgi:hypothetical protein